jgi:hypothetical protein
VKAWWLLVAVAAGCSGGSSPSEGATDLSTPQDLAAFTFTPAQLAPHTGAVLQHLNTWIVVWPGDEAAGAELDAFFRAMFADDAYWGATLAEYGVGAGRSNGVIVVGQPHPTSIASTDMEALVDPLAGSHATDAETAYVLVSPSGATITDVGPGVGGYHWESANRVPFMVLFQKPIVLGPAVESLTFVASHEAAETATDPHPRTSLGWTNDALGFHGEIGDLCEPLAAQTLLGADGGASTWDVSRLYSNARALAHENPCVPAPPGPYFNVAIDPPSFTLRRQSPTAPAVLHPFANGDVGPIDWEIVEATGVVVVSPASGVNHPGDGIPTELSIGLFNPGGNPVAVFAHSAQTGARNIWWFPVQEF